MSDEPIAHEDEDAAERLAGLVDGVLGHDRGIHIRGDDSVVRATTVGGTQVLRRSRRIRAATLPLGMPASRPVLAVRAALKSTVAVTVGTNVAAELGLRKDDTDPHVPQRATALASFESGPSPAALTALSR